MKLSSASNHEAMKIANELAHQKAATGAIVSQAQEYDYLQEFSLLGLPAMIQLLVNELRIANALMAESIHQRKFGK